MIAFLIILILTLAASAFVLTVRRSNRALPEVSKEAHLPPAYSAGLFADSGSEFEAGGEVAEKADDRRTLLIKRAAQGDTGALVEAQASGDADLYIEALDALIDSSERQVNLPALVKLILSSDDLRASVKLAERVIQSWKAEPDRRSTVDMLRIAALSDDAGIYGRAVEMALEAWRNGKLSDFRHEELIALFESHYWVLASEARRGGAGYALKRQIADARRDMAQATPAR